MKLLFFTLLILSSSQSIFAGTQDTCTDRRAALVGPCAEGTSRFYSQGSCQESYEFETTYCASEEMTNVEKVEGEVQVFPSPVGDDMVILHGSGHMIRTEAGLVSNCSNGIALIGQPKELVNSYDPSKGEIGIGSILINFKCLD